MAIDKFDIDTIPTLVKTLDTDETAVTVTVYNRVTRAAIPLSANTATQFPAGSGSWYWDIAFTTRPDNGQNQYEAFMIGTTYGQRRRILFDWNEDITLFDGAVHLNLSGGGTAGQGRYVGTDFRPSDNLTDALAIAARLNTKKIYVKGTLVLDQSIAGYELIGATANFTDVIVLGNFSIVGCRFEGLTLTGAWNGSAFASNCQLLEVTDCSANASSCVIMNSISIKDGGAFQADGTAFINYTTGVCEVDMQNSATAVFSAGSSNGVITLKNLAGGIFTANGTFIIQVDASVVAGQFFVSGLGNVDGTPGVPLTWIGEFTKAYFNPGLVLLWVNLFVPAAVHDTLMSEHVDAGTAGKALGDIDTDCGTIVTNIGTPTALDGAAATIGAMLTKMADDNGGASFDATEDSLNKISDKADAVKTQTDKMNFTGTDIKATLDSETVGLNDDAITSAKFDESTAYPLKSADTGSTQIARTGADSDTLEILSDQMDTLGSSIAAIPVNPILDTEDGSSFSAIPDMATESSLDDIKGTGFVKDTDSLVDLSHTDIEVTAQIVRDAMKLAPSAGDPVAGSIDSKLNAIPTNPMLDTEDGSSFTSIPDMAKDSTVAKSSEISALNNISAGDVWSYATRSLTSFGTLVSDIATAVWGATTRTLTSFGTLVTSIVSGVWSAAARTLTAFGFSVTVGDKTGYSLTADYDAAKTAASQSSVTAGFSAGAKEVTVSSIKTKTDNLPDGIEKGVALNNFEFVMVNAGDHTTPQTGLSVAGYIAKDGGAFAALTNAVSAKAYGIYKVNLTATEMNADIITLRFTAMGADARIITIKTS